MSKPKTKHPKIKTGNTYAFIDATNIIYGVKNHDWKVEHKHQIWLMSFSSNTARELKQLFKENFDNINRIKHLLERS